MVLHKDTDITISFLIQRNPFCIVILLTIASIDYCHSDTGYPAHPCYMQDTKLKQTRPQRKRLSGCLRGSPLHNPFLKAYNSPLYTSPFFKPTHPPPTRPQSPLPSIHNTPHSLPNDVNIPQ